MKHPDTIPNLDPDCRRVLRDAYQVIQVRRQAFDRATGRRQRCQTLANTYRLDQSRQRELARARTEADETGAKLTAAEQAYREVAQAWGVEV